MRRLLALGLVAALAVASACSDSNSPASPMAPSAVGSSAAPSSPAPAPASGAVLTGTVTLASSTRTVRPAGLGDLTVSVAGTNLSAPVDNNGKFTLTGVPAGDVQIQVTGSGVNATITVSGVQAGQTITLKITVSGSSGSIDSDSRDGWPDGKVELEGRIESVLAATSSLIVAGQTVTTSASTVIRRGDAVVLFADLLVGMRVHVKGTPDAATTPPSLAALEIVVQNENTNVPMKVQGVVAAAPPVAGTCPSITFVLDGKAITVTTSRTTNFKPSCADVAPGAVVEVMGRLQGAVSATDEDPVPPPGSTLAADKVDVKQAAPTAPGAGAAELEFKGALSGLGGSCPALSFTVGTQAIVTNGSTSFKPSCNALKNGDSVEVKGTLQGDGTVLATRVARE